MHDRVDVVKPQFSGFEWQDKAVKAWLDASGKGIVVGMTGTGKTHVALKALQALLDRGERICPLIVVPTTALLQQWTKRLQTSFPDKRFGQLGDGARDSFGQAAGGALPFAIVATIHSAVKAIQEGLFDHCNHGFEKSVVIADECHRYANEDQILFNRLLRRSYSYILGLSATMERFEVNGLGRIVFEYGIKEAVGDGVIPSFDVLNLAVNFNGVERSEYLALSNKIRTASFRLFDQYPFLKNLTGSHFWSELRHLVAEEDECALMYQGYLFKRAALAHEASAKLKLVPALIEHLVNIRRRKMLVFFERIWTADSGEMDLEDRLADQMKYATDEAAANAGKTIWCKVYHSKVNARERERVLQEFQSLGPSALLACRSLDEGLDVPDVDVGILIASTKSERQRLQRIGRTLRRGENKKKPLIIIVYVAGTTDEGVAIDPQDEKFAGAAEIYSANETNALPTIEKLLALSEPGADGSTDSTTDSTKSEELPAGLAKPEMYLWTEAVTGRLTPYSLRTLFFRLKPGSPIKLQLKSGKTVVGQFHTLVGEEVLTRSPQGGCGLKDVTRLWQGSVLQTTD